MGPNEKQIEFVGAYLRGELEGEELSDFLKELEENASLKEELNIQQAIQDGIEYRNNQEVRSRLNKIASENKTSEKNTRIVPMRIVKMVSSIAAVTLLCFAAYFLLNQSSDIDSIYATYFEPSELTITRSTNQEADLVKVKELYNTRKYKKALPLFEKIISENPSSSNLRLAYGNTLLTCNKINLARQQFNYIIDAKDPLFSDQSRWYLALLELKDGRVDQAKEALSFLVDDANSDFFTEAQALLKELNQLD